MVTRRSAESFRLSSPSLTASNAAEALCYLQPQTARARWILLSEGPHHMFLDSNPKCPKLKRDWRPGRLDREIEISVPTAEERAEILAVHLARVNCKLGLILSEP